MKLSGTPFSSFAVDDLEAAASFYRDVLALTVQELDMGLLLVRLADDSGVVVYPKPDHTPAGFTVLNLPVPDVGDAVDELGGRGVTFERYEGFEQDERGIARGGGGPAIAWFTDPAGNVLSVVEGQPFG